MARSAIVLAALVLAALDAAVRRRFDLEPAFLDVVALEIRLHTGTSH